MPECDLTLREWDFNAVLVQCVIDTFHDDTVVGPLCKYIHPDKNLQCDTAVVKALEQDIDRFFLVGDTKRRYGLGQHRLDLLDIASVCYAHLEDIQLIAMILRHVLVVLGEKLGVLEGDDRTVERFNQRGGVADGTDTAADPLADDVVADLDTSCHERDAVIDVLENVLHGETDTRRKTSRHDHQPMYC